MLFEVFIPARESDGYDETLTVEASNWMVALKSGLQRTGEEDMDMRSVMCDIKQDNTIHITDAISRRVFILKELDVQEDEETIALRKSNEQAAARAAVEAMEQRAAALQSPIAVPGTDPAIDDPSPTSPPEADEPIELDPSTIKAVEPTPEPQSVANEPSEPAVRPAPLRSGPVSLVDENGRPRIGSAEFSAADREKSSGRIVREQRQPTGQRPAVNVREELPSNVSENILEDIFLEIQVIHESDMSMEDAVNFVMDLSMKKVPAESGALLFADVSGQELYFATARGPKAQEVMEFRVPMGQGLAGFCAREGVTISISDAPADPRFYKSISEAIHYPTSSIACAPIQFEGRVYGCIELMNREGGTTFSSNEANALTYIGNQFAQYVNRLIMAREKL